MKLDIRHDPDGDRFFATIGGEEATLVYTVAGAKTLDFTSTYVPDTLRHRNIGEAIVKHALAYAAANGYEVIPTCPFVKWVLGRGRDRTQA
ncbi:MAG: N-acetyltransferase [Proteobacteria bacterium]|nr:N-acetyltransferase [Pseudomonadota bacterium]